MGPAAAGRGQPRTKARPRTPSAGGVRRPDGRHFQVTLSPLLLECRAASRPQRAAFGADRPHDQGIAVGDMDAGELTLHPSFWNAVSPRAATPDPTVAAASRPRREARTGWPGGIVGGRPLQKARIRRPPRWLLQLVARVLDHHRHGVGGEGDVVNPWRPALPRSTMRISARRPRPASPGSASAPPPKPPCSAPAAVSALVSPVSVKTEVTAAAGTGRSGTTSSAWRSRSSPALAS